MNILKKSSFSKDALVAKNSDLSLRQKTHYFIIYIHIRISVCFHGSTCGEIDPTALFYLTSRGIPKSEAQDMLVLAFLNEAIDEITSKEIQEIISKRLLDWMLKRHKS